MIKSGLINEWACILQRMSEIIHFVGGAPLSILKLAYCSLILAAGVPGQELSPMHTGRYLKFRGKSAESSQSEQSLRLAPRWLPQWLRGCWRLSRQDYSLFFCTNGQHIRSFGPIWWTTWNFGVSKRRCRLVCGREPWHTSTLFFTKREKPQTNPSSSTKASLSRTKMWTKEATSLLKCLDLQDL